MKFKFSNLFLIFFNLLSCQQNNQVQNKFITIAHRGASGYLPEHTLAGAAMAHAWGVDYIELDLVMTKDNQLVILHDPHLDTTTNVKELFPKRNRPDGRFYTIDFTLDEIKKLSVFERIRIEQGVSYYPQRFPLKKSHFEVPTMQEFIELVQGLNLTTGKSVGIYPEIKNPEFHEKEGKDITSAVMDVLKKYGYEENGQAIIQCFYPPTLKRLKNEFKTKIPLVLLIAENSWNESSVDYQKILTRQGIAEVATYAYGIGPWIPHLIKEDGTSSSVVEWAHEFGLKVHPYTHRQEEIPSPFKNENDFLDTLIIKNKVDGLFSDFADKIIKYRLNH